MHHAARAHAEPTDPTRARRRRMATHARTTITATGHAIDPHESPLVDAGAARGSGARRARSPASSSTAYFIGDGFDEFWNGALRLGPGNGILNECERSAVPASSSRRLIADGRSASSIACLLSISVRPDCRGAARRAAIRLLYRFLLNKWYFDELYDFLFVRPAIWLGRFLWKQRRRPHHRRLGPGRHRRRASST